VKTALSIAGSDPVGGAGIQADLKTFFAFGVYGMAVPTAITVQSTRGVTAVHPLSADLVAEQLRVLLADVRPDAVKIGMVGSADAAERIASILGKSKRGPIVLDPILAASEGTTLLDEAGLRVLKEKLLPLADLVTPNLDEATSLSGIDAKDADSMREAALAIRSMGTAAVLVTGGHLEDRATDVLATGEGVHVLDSARTPGRGAHGTGCALSSAIAAGLALGLPLKEAVRRAKAYVFLAIENGLADIGSGRILLNHFVKPPE